METTYIKFETAKLAKEKGFNENTGAACWVKTLDGDIIHNSERKDCPEHDRSEQYLSQPSQAQLQRWLRDKHNIHIQIRRMYAHDGEVEYNDFVYLPNKNAHTDDTLGNEFPTYEYALENALQTALNLL